MNTNASVSSHIYSPALLSPFRGSHVGALWSSLLSISIISDYLNLIPIFILLLTGYSLMVGSDILFANREPEMPSRVNLLNIIGNGFRFIILTIIFMILAIIMFSILAFIIALIFPTNSISTNNIEILVLTAITFLPFMILVVTATLHSLYQRRFLAAFQIKELIKIISRNKKGFIEALVLQVAITITEIAINYITSTTFGSHSFIYYFISSNLEIYIAVVTVTGYAMAYKGSIEGNPATSMS